MDVAEIRIKIKEIIANITNIDAAEIGDTASFVEDLQLDSLSLLEIGVDVDYEFKLGVPEERLQELRTVQDSVDLVVECLNVRSPRAEVAWAVRKRIVVTDSGSVTPVGTGLDGTGRALAFERGEEGS